MNEYSKQVKSDLKDIIDECNLLIGIAEEKLNKKNDLNRAYNVLLILRDEFSDELNEIDEMDELPF